jgi:hypothetical protein
MWKKFLAVVELLVVLTVLVSALVLMMARAAAMLRVVVDVQRVLLRHLSV